MDAGKLFSQLMNRGESASGGILTGTAVSDSVDGSVMVQMDGSVVAQPSEDETELVVSAEEFADGTYVLPSVPYAGTLTVEDSNGSQLEEDEYSLDGSTLTIHALSSAPVDVSYETDVQQVLTNSDFDGDSYSLPSVTNLTVREDGQAVPYTLDGNLLTIDGIEHVSGIVEFAYTYDVSVVCSAGENVLPNAPDEVAVFGRNSSGVDVVVTDYVLSGSTITLPDTYDAYTVDYPVSMVERWNVSDQYEEIPLEDSDDAADPETVTIGHNLQWEPSSVTSCTVDGVSTTYTLDVSNVVVDAPTITERYITLTYDSPVRMQVPASSFAVGPFTLPSVPVGSVITTMGGTVLANTVDDTQLTIESLLADSPTYTLSYTEQVEQDVVELPCTPYVAEGQFVEIAVVNGMPTVIGASGSGDVTMTLAGDAADAAAAAEEAATAAQEVAEAMNQHFWTDSNGVHVTEITQEEWAETPSGANQLSNSEGILLRDGLNPLVSVATGTDPGMSVFDGSGSQASNVVATFTGSGVTLGKSTESHAQLDYHSLQLIDKEGRAYFYVSDLRDRNGMAAVFERFFADGTSSTFYLTMGFVGLISVTVNGTALGPNDYTIGRDNDITIDVALSLHDEVRIDYVTSGSNVKAYTFGVRDSSVSVGLMSVVEGGTNVAAGWYSHAEGGGTSAFAHDSHAEGYMTITNEDAEASHAEGWYSETRGPYSHAQNCHTIASGESQTALGKFNVADTTSAVILGNGTSDTARSNALTVDWSGNVTASGNVSAANLGGPYYDGDMDDLVTPGIYYVAAASANLPEAVGSMVWLTASGNITMQACTARKADYPTYVRQRTASGNWQSWERVGGTAWTSLGSFTGTNSLRINLGNYNEAMVAAKANGKLVTATVAKPLLTSSTQELWLGGGKSSGGTANSGNLRAVVNISLTTVKGVEFSEGSTNRTSSTTWYVYAR